MHRTKYNLIANYLGQGWIALMGLAFTPLYISYLGIEAFSLIGFFSILYAWFSLLDMGISPTVGRELARFTGGDVGNTQIRNLLRTSEILMACMMLLVFSIMFFSAEMIAYYWLNTETISHDLLAFILVIMGGVIALRLGEGIYRGALMGLQRHVLFNAANVVLTTFRWLGALAVLEFVSPSLYAFFLWQGLVSCASILVLNRITYTVLPHSTKSGIFVGKEVTRVYKFASGMFGISLLTFLLMNTDKIILSKMLNLSELGYYYLATNFSAAMILLTNPISQTWYPKLCELYATGDNEGFVNEYHFSAQFVTCFIGSICAVLFCFTKEIVFLWTNDAELTAAVTLLMKVLLLGNFLSCLLYIPYQAQLAYGWTGLALKINLVSILIIVPALLLSVNEFGAIGAASVWLALNLGYFTIGTNLMYRRMLTDEKSEWFFKDILVPLAAILVTTTTLWYFLPAKITGYYLVVYLVLSFILIFMTAILCSSRIRNHVLVLLTRKYEI
ncbi:oligosaccharide flippase family protein [Planktomarina temperata]|nr:oligosaccharide flippase family protein [Planktomarina temperata]